VAAAVAAKMGRRTVERMGERSTEDIVLFTGSRRSLVGVELTAITTPLLKKKVN
jgi:hypothetical protein